MSVVEPASVKVVLRLSLTIACESEVAEVLDNIIGVISNPFEIS